MIDLNEYYTQESIDAAIDVLALKPTISSDDLRDVIVGVSVKDRKKFVAKLLDGGDFSLKLSCAWANALISNDNIFGKLNINYSIPEAVLGIIDNLDRKVEIGFSESNILTKQEDLFDAGLKFWINDIGIKTFGNGELISKIKFIISNVILDFSATRSLLNVSHNAIGFSVKVAYLIDEIFMLYRTNDPFYYKTSDGYLIKFKYGNSDI